jgi:hypothetical protein
MHMSYVYDDTGELRSIKFTDEAEPEPKPHWYDVGTRIIFKAVQGGGLIAVVVA